MAFIKDYLTVNSNLEKALDEYTEQQIEGIASSFDYYTEKDLSKIKLKALVDDYRKIIDIIKVIVKSNLLSAYYNYFSDDVSDFAITINFDEIDTLINNLYTKKLANKLFRATLKTTHSKMIKYRFKSLTDLIRTNRLLKRFITGNTNEIIYNFDDIFRLLMKLNLNNNELMEATICIVANNIFNGMLEEYEFQEDEKIKNPTDGIRKAHYLIQTYYLDRMNDKKDIDREKILEAFILLGYPNIYAISPVLEKMRIKREPEKKEKVYIKKNIESKIDKADKTDGKEEVQTNKDTSLPVIDKMTYHEGVEIINRYYNLDTGAFSKVLKMSEIQYVVSVMQSLNFSSRTIETFISKALKRHKNIGALDRYLDLSQKIDYYKEERDIEQLDKTLHDLVDEYIKSSSEDKEFWLTSINEELEALESLLNRTHNYELGIKKSQE